MPATATYLGSLTLQYPTAPGTYDLSFSFSVGVDCPAGSMVVLHFFERQDVGTPRSRAPSSGTDDAGNFYGPQTFSSGNFVHGGAIAASLTLGGLVAGQQIHCPGPTVTISAPSGSLNNPDANFILFGILWQGVSGGALERSAVVAAGGGLGNTSYHLVTPSRTAPVGTVDMIGVACADLAMQQPAGVATVGSPVDVTCTEDGPFSRIQTILWDAPFPRTDNAENYNGPGVYISKATVTVAAPTAETFGATLFDPTTYNPSGFFEYERNDYFAQIWCPASVAPVGGAGVANLHDRWGRYMVAQGAAGGLRYRRSHFDRPPFALDVTPTTVAGDSRPSIAQDWRGWLWILFERGGDTWETYSTDHGRTWSGPVVVLSGGTHPCNKTDPENGLRLRAAYKAHTIIADVRYPGDLAPSSQFTFKDAGGVALGVEDDDFDLSLVGPSTPRRYQLAARKTGATEVSFWYSTDFARTWTEETA